MFRPYNPNVLIGNWYEDRVLEEDVIKDYLEKRQNGQLVGQLNDAKNIPVSMGNLTTVTDGKIHFGDTILIKCEGTSNQTKSLVAKPERKDCFLGISELVRNVPNVAASGIAAPVYNERTGLVLQSVDGTLPGQTIKFGQPFAISTFDKSFYLHSDIRLVDRAAHQSRLQIVDFQTVYNHECDWYATCLNPKFRLEAEGSDIPANEKILILHMKTNKALAVVANFSNSGRFEIVAHTFLDSHKAEEDVNHWQFMTHVPTMSSLETR